MIDAIHQTQGRAIEGEDVLQGRNDILTVQRIAGTRDHRAPNIWIDHVVEVQGVAEHRVDHYANIHIHEIEADLTVFGDGSQTRSFCFISDMVEGICRVLKCSDPGPINLGNPDEITMADLAREIISLTASSSGVAYAPLPVDDPKRRRPDLTRAGEILGWKPSVGREEGLRAAIEHLRGEA